MILLLYQLSYAAKGEQSLQHGAVTVNETDCKARPTVFSGSPSSPNAPLANHPRISLSLKSQSASSEPAAKTVQALL